MHWFEGEFPTAELFSGMLLFRKSTNNSGTTGRIEVFLSTNAKRQHWESLVTYFNTIPARPIIALSLYSSTV
ncbi:hypothetical protein GCM10017764_21950 [Sphingobacterium griseoflavum]|uniref:Uncharacterized protein n=1 Tax=Sphingobacterium griseoflavum TaxID=1474952 RepID=A0ABQ3I0E0_9SPHI|nr:hypothetical protein GCM10017764_21950 [Sphingobacterium griseoflavum]